MKTVGKQLQDARLAKGWSPEMAARETKIKVGRLHDLEVDDYSNFSSPTYARGFVRTYARSLGLDEYRILRQLDNKLPEDDNASFINDTGVPYMPEASQVSKPFEIGRGVYVAGGVGLAVLLLIGFILLQSYRAGYFAAATPAPAALPVSDTNALPAVADSGAARAMPADGSAPPAAVAVETPAKPAAAALPVDTNGPPRAVPVDLGAVSGGTNAPAAVPAAPAPATAATTAAAPATTAVPSTNAPAVAATATPATAETPSNVPTTTHTPPRALPVDLTALNAPDTNAAPVATIPEIPPPAAEPATTPVHHSLSARESNSSTPDVHAANQATQALIAATTPPATQPAPAAETVAPNPPVSAVVTPAATNVSSPAQETPALPETSTPAATPVAAPPATTPAPTASTSQDDHFHGKRLVLTASHDSFIRVVALDGPDAGQVRYASVLHSGQSISFNDRKYSINVADASAVDIALDGVNYGPHGDTAAPQTFIVESHTP